MLTSIYCPNCRRQIPEDVDFCPHCGGPASQRARIQAQARAHPQNTPHHQPAAAVPPDHQPASYPDSPAPSQWWNTWFLPPTMRGTCRYPVLRIYQYICIISGWLILGGSLLTAIIGLGSTFSTGVDIDEVLICFAFPLGGMLIFLNLRAFVEMLQVYLDIEDNTRAAAQPPTE